MWIRSLQVRNFRNLTAEEFYPDPGLNVIVGPNAQGKTNLLEAIFYAGRLTPFRGSRDADLVRHGQSVAWLLCAYERDGSREEIEIEIPTSGRRRCKINGSPVHRLSDAIGRLSVVSFCATDLAIVSGEPSDRRQFLDDNLASISHKYRSAIEQYKRCLEQRNALLRNYAENRGGLDDLPEWNAQLGKHGGRIMAIRQLFLTDLNGRASAIHPELSNGKDRLKLDYHPAVQEGSSTTEAEWSERLMQSLQLNAKEEQRRGMTLSGPHRDDFVAYVDDKDARSFASQGQQRTAALSIKMAQIGLVEDRLKHAPIVLLDDVFSDLDPNRRQDLMKFLEGRAQTLITCTDLGSFSDKILERARITRVLGGRLMSIEKT